ncbi:anthranilate synthase component I family protein [Pontibacter sp. G13]|uniref:anthranilate synthase component I family protein n=1 Tax=Pontibacter sp. G13 TaxID=3074898 RepID=UPI00288B8B47|nr:anthranilate synthase component I family protein [Pontibacter sp. G13]WNJ19584.1 anthranilate synthase component I family protein [Pontibacter sp. G13]
MNTYHITIQHTRLLADTITPVSLYLKLRDHFERPLLLESSDYHGQENPYSYICLEPMAEVKVDQGTLYAMYPDGKEERTELTDPKSLINGMQSFLDAFKTPVSKFPFSTNGLFGYTSYDAVRHMEKIDIQTYEDDRRSIPDVWYSVYRYVIVVDHAYNDLYLFEHGIEGEAPQGLDKLLSLIQYQALPQYEFDLEGDETSNLTDEEFLGHIDLGIKHCQRGDVFQMVLSRQFQQGFVGDEFNVYRCLRAINPSPYLFFADYGAFRLMGSSPEAQLVIKGGEASIHPIAGTFRRTGRDSEDMELAKQLASDPKEVSEHVMLVDLARNDLSRHGADVKVETFKEVQYFSHVIHLVSKVTAQLGGGTSPLQLVADTFPAGTLSGAPKYRAMELIDEYENQNRGFYGGCIGYMGFDGSFNQAIMIRSLLSKNHMLYFQAGAGIVSKSKPNNELQEVHNKLGAIRAAIQRATKMSAPSVAEPIQNR